LLLDSEIARVFVNRTIREFGRRREEKLKARSDADGKPPDELDLLARPRKAVIERISSRAKCGSGVVQHVRIQQKKVISSKEEEEEEEEKRKCV